MDYFSLAEQMLSVRARLSHLPAGEAISDACGGEFFALSLLLLDDAPGCPSGLSRSMGVSSARIAALLKHLEQKGWIRRCAHEPDERRVNVSLTDEGAERIARGAVVFPRQTDSLPETADTICRVYHQDKFLMLGQVRELDKGGLGLFVYKNFR